MRREYERVKIDVIELEGDVITDSELDEEKNWTQWIPINWY